MVSIAIFSIVMVIVIGALLMLNDANKKAQALRAVVDNLNFAIEDITRNLKTGTDYSCGLVINNDNSVDVSRARFCESADLTSGTKGIIFKGNRITGGGGTIRYQCYGYFITNYGAASGKQNTIKYVYSTTGATQSCLNSNVWRDTKATEIISPEVIINNGKFFVSNPPATDPKKQQPITIITINGEIDIAKYKFKTPFDIQTTVSQRSSVE